MTKTKILKILLSLYSCSFFGQTSYLKQIEKGKYVKAEKKLNKALKKESNDVVLNYAMSRLLMSRNYKSYNTKAGLAWPFKKYNNDCDLSELEIKAKESKIGLWVDESPMPPWDNRSLHRHGVSTKDSFDIKEGQQ